jgi:hypothetical protein
VLNDREQAEDRSLHQDVLQSIHSDFRAAVSWARRTFHAHGFPSSCYVRYSGEKKAWTVVSGVQYRQSDDHGPQGIMPISHVIGAEYLPGSEEGSQLYFSNYILSLFREVMNLRSSIALLKQNMKLVEELLEQLRLAVSRGDSRKVLSLADGLSESKLHTASGEWHVLHLMDHLHRMLAAHKQALIRAEIEPDALWRREMARAARSHGKMATRTNTGKANERQAAFHKHLDNCRKSERWMLMSDPRKVSKAKASFDKMLEGDEELKTLFRPVKRLAWYESSFAEWRKQRIENVVDS